MVGASPNIPISSGGPPAGRINSMKLVQHNKHIIHNVAMFDLKLLRYIPNFVQFSKFQEVIWWEFYGRHF